MDFHTSDSDSRYLPDLPEEPSYPGSPNRMSQAAFVCGILSLVGIFFNASIFFGAFAILFALLSRRKRFSRQAKAAVRMAAVGISLAALAVIISIVVLISSGLLGKYTKRIANINPDDPAAVTKIENDLMKDLAKAYGVDPSPLQQSQNEENSPFDPTIENDHSADSAQSDADSSASENSGTQSKAGNFRIQSKTPSGSDYI
jgi:ABC-type lipoprotein release transport system permease subunit